MISDHELTDKEVKLLTGKMQIGIINILITLNLMLAFKIGSNFSLRLCTPRLRENAYRILQGPKRLQGRRVFRAWC